jgi:hypothetical protein
VTETIIAPIRRQEPGHFAFYQMSARGLWAEMAEWQRWLVRRVRSVSFAPVGAGSREQKADVGDMMVALGIGTAEASEQFVESVARTEMDLLWAAGQGLQVPSYISQAFRECLDLARGDAEVT